ncbi:MAG: branched-chain amino acid ABC transporter permease [Firmicutes bacterium]|nr:branched-chain amino acid ABC transporter permease [Bacillota bacterium]
MARCNYKRAWEALRAAFPLTLPVLAGFGFLGIAYGVLMQGAGLGAGWTFLLSFFVYAGSIQYAALMLFSAPFNPLGAFVLTLTVNARHVFYGLSTLDKLNSAGKIKPYLIFGLSDEAFSLICAHQPPQGVDAGLFMFVIVFLCRLYWIAASVCGALLGSLLTFSTKGLDFALTAMFVVIFSEQWQEKANRISLAVGAGCSLVSLIIFGPNNFLIPAMILILPALILSSQHVVGDELK